MIHLRITISKPMKTIASPFFLMVAIGLLFTPVLTASDALIIREIDGKSTPFPISEIRNMTFDDAGKLLVHKRDQTVTFSISGIRNMQFGNEDISSLPKLHSSASAVQVFPVPMVDELNIHLDAHYDQSVDIQLIDINGRVHLHKRIPAAYGARQVHFDVGMLSKGIYLCRIIIGEEIITRKLIK